MSRFIFGPGIDYNEPSPELAALGLPSVSIRNIRAGGLVDLGVGLVVAVPLLNLFIAYLFAPPSPDADPKATYDAAAIKGQLAPEPLAAGGEVTIQVAPAPVPRTSYYVQTILEIPD